MFYSVQVSGSLPVNSGIRMQDTLPKLLVYQILVPTWRRGRRTWVVGHKPN